METFSLGTRKSGETSRICLRRKLSRTGPRDLPTKSHSQRYPKSCRRDNCDPRTTVKQDLQRDARNILQVDGEPTVGIYDHREGGEVPRCWFLQRPVTGDKGPVSKRGSTLSN